MTTSSATEPGQAALAYTSRRTTGETRGIPWPARLRAEPARLEGLVEPKAHAAASSAPKISRAWGECLSARRPAELLALFKSGACGQVRCRPVPRYTSSSRAPRACGRQLPQAPKVTSRAASTAALGRSQVLVGRARSPADGRCDPRRDVRSLHTHASISVWSRARFDATHLAALDDTKKADRRAAAVPTRHAKCRRTLRLALDGGSRARRRAWASIRRFQSDFRVRQRRIRRRGPPPSRRDLRSRTRT